jgi:hypothetical protein
VGWLDSLRGTFSFLFAGSRTENVVAEYIVREHHRGRSVTEILEDPYVTNRLSAEQVRRVLDRPEVLHAIGNDSV